MSGSTDVTDDTHFSKVDIENVIVREGKGNFGPDIVRKDRKYEAFSICSAPMRAIGPLLCKEGTVGLEKKISKTETSTVLDRKEGEFKLGLGVGDLGDPIVREVLPTLKADQMLFAKKCRQAADHILGLAYDARLKDFAKKIASVEAEVLKTEAAVQAALGRKDIASIEDLRRAMAKDPALKATITAKCRADFVAKAKYNLPDAFTFDEDGVRIRKDVKNEGAGDGADGGGGQETANKDGETTEDSGGVERLIINVKRKVYTREDEHRKKTKKEMEDPKWTMSSASTLPPTQGMGSKPGSSYPDIVRDVAGKYRWNPFKFTTDQGPLQHPWVTYIEEAGKPVRVVRVKDEDIPPIDPQKGRRPYFVSRTDEKGIVYTTVQDPDWDPVPARGKQTLISLRVKFKLFTVQDDVGIKLIPDDTLNIVYQTEQQERSLPKDNYSNAAALIAARKAELAAGDKRTAEEAEIPPADAEREANRQRTDDDDRKPEQEGQATKTE